MELPRVTDWTYDTVLEVVQTYEFEPGEFDFKGVLNPIGDGKSRDQFLLSLRRDVCAMANTNGGFILFGVQDRQIPAPSPQARIVGIPYDGELPKQFNEKIKSSEPDVHFDPIPAPLVLPNKPEHAVFVVYIPLSPRRPHMADHGFYRRGPGGIAIPMSVVEVRDQMLHMEERLRKVTLFRLKLAQYRSIVEGLLCDEPEIRRGMFRFDIGAYEILLADICGLLPMELVKELLVIPLHGNLINRLLQLENDRVVGTLAFLAPQPDESQTILGNLHGLKLECEEREQELERIFGPLTVIAHGPLPA